MESRQNKARNDSQLRFAGSLSCGLLSTLSFLVFLSVAICGGVEAGRVVADARLLLFLRSRPPLQAPL